MKNKYLSAFILLIFAACGAKNELVIKKYTAVNPVSYTDVIYSGIRDTALVSTYSGRIAKRINGLTQEIVIAQLGSEVYSMAYNPRTKVIAASTYEEGIVLVNERGGKAIKTLKLPTWSNFIIFSDDFRYLAALDQQGNTHLWDGTKGYEPLSLPADFPKGIIRSINVDQVATISSRKSIVYWNISTGKLVGASKVNLQALADTDSEGMALSIDFNACHLYNMKADRIEFTLKHPSWPLPNTENPLQVYDIPFQMQLTTAKFAGDKIFTASIDRTLRAWDKKTGKLLKTISDHKGTVNKIRVAKDESQIVSVDLKGGIYFSEVGKL